MVAPGVALASNGFTATNLPFSLTLQFAPTLGTQLTIVNNTATPAAGNPIVGTLNGLPQGGTYTTSYLGIPYVFSVEYTGGDGNGYEVTPANACTVDGAVATDASTGTNTNLVCTDAGKDRHRFWDFSLGVPSTVSAVGGIQVRTDVGLNNNAGNSAICAQLSWDAGTTWTAAKSVTVANVGVTTFTLGATNDTWGRTWLGSDFSNANFRVRLIDMSDRTTKDFRLDGLAVQVTYTP
jgi:hypothetical protein